MKKKFLKIIVISAFILNFSGCMADTEKETVLSDNSQTSSIETENLESTEYTYKEVIGFVLKEIRSLYISEEEYSRAIGNMLQNAEALSKRTYGKIVSKDDAVKKARDVLIESKGEKYIERIETEYDEEYLKYSTGNTKVNSRYTAWFYDEYDVWIIKPILHSDKAEKGKTIEAYVQTDTVVVMRGSDGEVLAVVK